MDQTTILDKLKLLSSDIFVETQFYNDTVMNGVTSKKIPIFNTEYFSSSTITAFIIFVLF